MLIISRNKWTSRRPRQMTKQAITNVKELFLHWPGNHTTKKLRPNQEQALLRSWLSQHMDTQGWSFIGYNFAVFASGRIYRLRGGDWVPAAQQGHNTNTIAVVCVGPVTDKMKAALVDLKNHLDRRAGRDLRVRGHGEVVNTACPGPELRKFAKTLHAKA